MAGELKITDTSGKTVYACIFNNAGQTWTGGNTFGAVTATTMNANVVALTEADISHTTGIYIGNFPTTITSPGRYTALFYEEGSTIAGPLVSSDSKLGSSSALDWNGTGLNTIGISLPNIAAGTSGGLPTGDSSGNVGLKVGAIDLVQLSATLKAISLKFYLVSSGTTTPATADTYYIQGLANGVVYLVGEGTGEVIWSDLSYWYITPVVNTIPASGTSYFKSTAITSGGSSTGPYTVVVNGGSGSSVNPTIVAHGNAVLAGFQPETVNILGSIANVSGTVSANITEVNGAAVTGGVLQTVDLTNIVNTIMAYAVDNGISFLQATQRIGAVCAGNFQGTSAGGIFQGIGGTNTRIQTSISGANRTNVGS